jgi:hypothetical protein
MGKSDLPVIRQPDTFAVRTAMRDSTSDEVDLAACDWRSTSPRDARNPAHFR